MVEYEIGSMSAVGSAARSSPELRSRVGSKVKAAMLEEFSNRSGIQPERARSPQASDVYYKLPNVMTWFRTKLSMRSRSPVELACRTMLPKQ